MKLLLVILVFVGLKLWELAKVIGTLLFIALKWIFIIGFIVSVIVGIVWLFVLFISWEYNLFNEQVHEMVLVIGNIVIVAFGADRIKWLYDNWNCKVVPFFQGNWNKANKIVEKWL